MATLRAARHAAREGGQGPFARLLAIAREGESASTPLVLLALLSAALVLFIAVTLTVSMLLYELL